jgi:hypothetical protein
MPALGRRFGLVVHVVDQAKFLRLASPHMPAARDHLGSRLDARQARGALCAAGARQDAQVHFRQAHLRALDRHPVVTAQRHLEPAAKGRAVQRCNDRLFARFDHVRDVRQLRVGQRLAELLDIRACDERPPCPADHRGLGLAVTLEPLDRLEQAVSNRVRQRIDRRVVDGDDGHFAIKHIADWGCH